jgi:hypothetical protein
VVLKLEAVGLALTAPTSRCSLNQIKTALVEIRKLLWGPEARVRDAETKRFVADELTRLANEFKALADRIVQEQTGG